VVAPNCAFFAGGAEERLPDKVEEISGAHPAEAARSSIGAAHDAAALRRLERFSWHASDRVDGYAAGRAYAAKIAAAFPSQR
jgi:hypothetical protein